MPCCLGAAVTFTLEQQQYALLVGKGLNALTSQIFNVCREKPYLAQLGRAFSQHRVEGTRSQQHQALRCFGVIALPSAHPKLLPTPYRLQLCRLNIDQGVSVQQL
jgi:hypothetical protein